MDLAFPGSPLSPETSKKGSVICRWGVFADIHRPLGRSQTFIEFHVLSCLCLLAVAPIPNTHVYSMGCVAYTFLSLPRFAQSPKGCGQGSQYHKLCLGSLHGLPFERKWEIPLEGKLGPLPASTHQASLS